MTDTITSVLLWTHIIAGFTALVTGVVPMVTKKGGQNHKRYGKVYFWAMLFVFITAISLSIIRPSLFLFLIAIFSFYLALTGVRTISLKRMKVTITTFDRGVTYLMLLAGIAMLFFGTYNIKQAKFSLNIILLVFAFIGLSLAIGDLRRFKKPFVQEKLGTEWFFNHLTRMIAAYIATFTAFAVVNITFLPGLVVWLGPTVVGTIVITIFSTHYRKKFSKKDSFNV